MPESIEFLNVSSRGLFWGETWNPPVLNGGRKEYLQEIAFKIKSEWKNERMRVHLKYIETFNVYRQLNDDRSVRLSLSWRSSVSLEF